MSELTDEEKARHRRAAEAIVHHVRWHRPEIALELAQALREVAVRHGFETVHLARGAQEILAELTGEQPG